MGLFGKKKTNVSEEELKKRGEFAMIVERVKRDQDPKLMALMADRLMRGEGTPKDTQKAVYWYEKAYEMGYTNAAFLLAIEYGTAKNIPFDSAQAKKWAQIALDAGDARGQQILDALKV